MFSTRVLAMLLFVFGSALAQDTPAETAAPAPAQVEMTTPVFEMFRLVPGKAEDFIRSIAVWDEVNIAGGQPPSQMFVRAGSWDVLLYKPSRPRPTPAQEAAMAAKIKELGLPTGWRYFLEVREQMAEQYFFEATGPTTAAQWLEELERERAEARGGK